MPVQMVVMCGVRKRGWIRAKVLRQQSVARHRHEDARLAELKDEQHRSESGQRSRADQRLRPGLPRKGRCHRGRIAEVSRVFSHPGENARHQDVENRADDKTGDHPDRQITLRIFRFLGRGRDGIEPDEGEKDDRSSTHYSAKTARHERVPVGRVDHKRAKGNDENNDCELDDDDGCVRRRALANAVDQEHSDRHDDEKCGQIEGDRMSHDDGQRGGRIIAQRRSAFGDDGAGGGVITHQPKRKLQVQAERQIAEQLDKIARPPDSHGHVADRVFENQIPSDDPGDDLAQGRVGISVS